MMDQVSSIARALLYEGYILWPYRRSALKNRQRWTLGGVYPPAYAAAIDGVDRAMVRAECLAETTAEAHVHVSVRFLQVVARQILGATIHGMTAIDELEVDGCRYLSWDEAVERDVSISLALSADGGSIQRQIAIAANSSREEVRTSSGAIAGGIERRWEALSGLITVTAQPAGALSVQRIAVSIENTSNCLQADRHSAVRRAFVSAHAALSIEHGRFVSLLEPPAHLTAMTAACKSEGLWPVLVGEEGSGGEMLASPMILYDYPRVAPESPGDLFDGGEIDQLLILNVLAMTDDEQREMRDTDPRAREILERCRSLSPDGLQALHGTIRSLKSAEERQ
jgi:hypothetical protein